MPIRQARRSESVRWRTGSLPAESAKLADIHLVFVYGPIRVIRVIRGCLKVFSPKLLSQLRDDDQSPRGFPTQKSGILPDREFALRALQPVATGENPRNSPSSWLNGS